MPIPSPFHERTAPLCVSYKWKDWAGYYAVCTYDYCHEREYFAFRESAGLIDVTPLYKYEVHGPDAQAFLTRMMVRDISKLSPGRVTYCCWCDDDGKVVDDGTVTRIDDTHYRVTAADPSLAWMQRLARGYDVTLEDSSARFGALALQGPTSRDILRQCTDADLDALKFFRHTTAKLRGIDVQLTRTGYTGDLGYEVWVERDRAVDVWDALIDAGRPHGIVPAGLDALDMARIEAGFIMLHVDYFSATKTVVDKKKSSPFELGLEWTVDLDREPFVGQAALAAEKAAGSEWAFVGLELSWEEIEKLYESYGLPPSLPAQASRTGVPVYQGKKQVGHATSHTWSPILKKPIALAQVKRKASEIGTHLSIEHTVEYERRHVTATVVKTPFFDPERKRKP